VIASAIWVAVDASSLGARAGRLNGGMLDMGPAGWFFVTLLIWIVGFPCYLVARPRYVALKQAEEQSRPHAPLSPTHAGGFCRKCGSSVDVDDTFCAKCGSKNQ